MLGSEGGWRESEQGLDEAEAPAQPSGQSRGAEVHAHRASEGGLPSTSWQPRTEHGARSFIHLIT